MKKGRKAVVIVLIALVLLTTWFAFCGYQWKWGPFMKLNEVKIANHPGNAEEYDLTVLSERSDSPLSGKHIVFLGSSITHGSGSVGISFADYICAENDAKMTKEAIPGTTLVDNGPNSYVSRLKTLDPAMQVDLMVCQLSTNDCWQDSPLGAVSDSKNMEDFDTQTIAGAMEYTIAYTMETWGCPVVFYTNPRFENEQYGQMVDLLHRLGEKWGICVVDMWNDAQFNAISEADKALYMMDNIHPTKAGYLKWWVPYMEPYLCEALGR